MSGTTVDPPYSFEGAEEQGPSGGGNQWLGRRDHPLLNDLILDIILGYVRRCDLKAGRVVCKKWNLRTLPHMRSTFRVTIHGSYSHLYKCSDKMSGDTRRIDDFINLFRSNELGIPFSEFLLGSFRTRVGIGQQFLQLCAEIATEIDLNLGGWKSQIYLIQEVSEILRSCPNLNVLIFCSHLFSYSGEIVKLFPDSSPTFHSLRKITFGNRYPLKLGKCYTSAITELLTAAPNVSDIVVHDVDEYFTPPGNENGSASHITAVLDCIEMLGMESSIESLSLYEVRDQHTEQLQRMAEKAKGLKLKSLLFRRPVIPDTDFTGVHTQLFTNFRHTLQHLNAGNCIEILFVDFPTVPNLKSLTLRAGGDSQPRPANLNHKFPVLETLDLDFYSITGWWENGFSEFQSCPTIKSLTLSNYSMTILTLHNIFRVFPNLTKFSLKVGVDGEEIMREMWSQMTGLESLTISGFIQNTEELGLDSLFTGIPIQTLKEIRHAVNELEEMTVEERRERIEEIQNPPCRFLSIQNLTHLTHFKFSLRGVGRNGHVHLTDLTAYLAFYSMALVRLKHLDVQYYTTFTKTCCEILTKETGLESWRFQDKLDQPIIPPFVLHGREDL